MSKVGLVVGLVVTASCGRLGFGEQAAPDSPPIDTAGDAATDLLACGAPTRFTVGAAAIAGLAATSTTAGYAIATIDTAGNLAASAFELADTTLAIKAQNIAIGSGLRDIIDIAPLGDGVAITAVFDLTTALGTNIYPRRADLTEAAPVAVRTGDIAVDRGISKSGISGDHAFVTIDPTTADVTVHAIDASGADLGAPSSLVSGADDPGDISVRPSHTGYIASWVATAASPDVGEIALLDPATAKVTGPAKFGNIGEGPVRPQVAWMPIANRYLVVWFEKTSTDDIWMQMFDADLEPVAAPKLLSPDGHTPRIAADGTDFWVTWLDFGTGTDVVTAVRVAVDGTTTPRPVTNSGGTPREWAMVERNGQAVLVWAEVGGSGPDLYFDPMCL